MTMKISFTVDEYVIIKSQKHPNVYLFDEYLYVIIRESMLFIFSSIKKLMEINVLIILFSYLHSSLQVNVYAAIRVRYRSMSNQWSKKVSSKFLADLRSVKFLLVC